jgi:DNA-binding transcriptional regulator YhcF (GntR family)
MAQEASVNPNTMQRALAKLEEDDLVITHRTSGRSITEDAHLVERAKTKLARAQILEFLGKMELLSFDLKQVLNLMDNIIKEMEK